MRLASRILAFALFLSAPAHAAPGDPDPQGPVRSSLAPSDPAQALSSAEDSLRSARLGVTAGTPPGRYAHSAIFDPIGRRMIVYGGLDFGSTDDLWEMALEGYSAWSEILPGTVPAPARGAHVAVRDTVRNRMLVFGGAENGVRMNSTWAYTLGPGGGWSQLTVAGTPPSPRSLHSAIYDPVRDRLIVFGGYHDTGYLNDVWALTLSGTPTWSPLAVGGTPPTPRRECSAIYDPVRDRMIVFGGTNGVPNREVWALNLSPEPTWTLLTSGGTGLAARSGHSAVYDPGRDMMWMFAGRDVSGTILNDLWTLPLSGSPEWQAQTPLGTPPGTTPAATSGHPNEERPSR